jgi:hypothetical protein
MKAINITTAKLLNKLSKLNDLHECPYSHKFRTYLEDESFDDPRSGDIIIFREKGETYFESLPLSNNIKTIDYNAPYQTDLHDYILKEYGIFISIEISYYKWGNYNSNLWMKNGDFEVLLLFDGMSMFDNPSDALEDGLETALEYLINN